MGEQQMKGVLIILSLWLIIASSALTACGGQKIRVGSYPDPEGMLMAQLIIQMLSENGFDAIDAGTIDTPHQALQQGKIDVYPEYTVYYLAEDTANPKNGVVWLKPAPADSKWAIVIPERLSEAENIRNMSDFAAYVNSKKGNVKLITSPDFIADKYALPNFEHAYGFTLESDQLVIVPSYNFVYMWTQAASTDNDINAAIAYTTGGKPEEYNLVLLKDDKGSQPEFNPAPLIRKEVYNKYAEQLNRSLTPLFASLDDNTLRELNSKSGLVGKQATAEVARNYLIENGYFKYNELQMVQQAMDEMMADSGLNSVSPHPGATTDMSAFPDKEHALYRENVRWPYLTWRITRGSYTCNSNGLVTQMSTGW
jgi:osmoprotectant transport system substrate-binding protein